MSRIDWPALMRFGLAELRLSPGEFWQLTPAELQTYAGERAGGTAMSRAGLDALLARFPDDQEKEAPDGGQ